MNPQDLTTKVAQLFYGTTPEEAREKKICLSCKEEAKTFRDRASEKEYTISGFCQTCQDKIFTMS